MNRYVINNNYISINNATSKFLLKLLIVFSVSSNLKLIFLIIYLINLFYIDNHMHMLVLTPLLANRKPVTDGT